MAENGVQTLLNVLLRYIWVDFKELSAFWRCSTCKRMSLQEFGVHEPSLQGEVAVQQIRSGGANVQRRSAWIPNVSIVSFLGSTYIRNIPHGQPAGAFFTGILLPLTSQQPVIKCTLGCSWKRS